MPRLSLKQFFLPQSEDLFSWKQRGAEVAIRETPTTFNPRVVLGAKPCDAAALEIVDAVMNWEYPDELWNGRRAATTIFALACAVEDQHCFCPSVGAAPDTVKGADGLLTPVDGGFLVEAVTDKGRAFVEAHRARFAAAPDGAADARARLPRRRHGQGRREHADRRRTRAGLDRESLRGPLLGHSRRALQRLRRVHHGLPHLPLLRHRRRGRGRRLRHAPPLLGHLSGRQVHPARLGSQPPRRPDRPLSPAHQPQVRHLPRQVRRRPVHRLRALRAHLPDGPEHRRDPRRDRRVRAGRRSQRAGER